MKTTIKLILCLFLSISSTVESGTLVFGPAAVPTSSSYTPPSGVQVWYSVDSFVALSDGASLTNWPDISGNGNHLLRTIGNAVYSTTAMNGRPSVTFGGDVYQSTSAIDLSGTDDVTFLVVVKSVATSTQIILEFGPNWFGGTGGIFMSVDTASSTVGYGHRWGGVASSTATASGITSGGVVIGTSDGALTTGETEIELNGIVATSGAGNTTGNFNSQNLNVGARSGGVANLSGSISEIILWNRKLNSSELSAARNYFMAKYGY